MVLLTLFLACTGATDDAAPASLPSHVYAEDMWLNRALTVRSGLDEALAMRAESPARAGEHVQAVYRASFEAELEPTIRATLGRRDAANLEYAFGHLLLALERQDALAANSAVEGLDATLKDVAIRLDAQRAVLP